MMQSFIRLLQLAGLLGCGLSLLALGIAVYLRVDVVLRQAPFGGGPATAGGMLQILDALKEPGIAFLLSALLFAVCEIAARNISHAQDRPRNPDGDYNSTP